MELLQNVPRGQKARKRNKKEHTLIGSSIVLFRSAVEMVGENKVTKVFACCVSKVCG